MVDGVAQRRDRPATCNVDLPRRQYWAGIDTRIDQVHTAADRHSFEGRPFSNIHPTIRRQQTHMRVEDAEPEAVDQRPAQQAGSRMNAAVRMDGLYCSDGLGAVERTGFEDRDAA